jgi:AraC-like DNA-binding protein
VRQKVVSDAAGAREILELQVNWRSFDYNPTLSKVRNFVEERYGSDLSLAVIARVAGMERSYFSAYFHRQVGVCLSEWISHVRVAEAKRILSRSDQSIQATSNLVGFANVRTFERAFKRITKLTPREFKRAVCPTTGAGPAYPRESPRPSLEGRFSFAGPN